MTTLTAPPTDTLSSERCFKVCEIISVLYLAQVRKTSEVVLPGSMRKEKDHDRSCELQLSSAMCVYQYFKTLVDCATAILTEEAPCFITKTSNEN